MNTLKSVEIDWTPYGILEAFPEREKEQLEALIRVPVKDLQSNKNYSFCFLKRMEDDMKEFSESYEELKTIDIPSFIWRDVYSSCVIEGANLNMSRALAICNGATIDEANESECMIAGYQNAFEFLCDKELTKEILREGWELLTKNCCHNSEIAGTLYRSGNVRVGNHVPIDYSLVEESMEQWLAFYKSDELEEYPLIKAAILHYMFEDIHPYCDGNGRMGRLLMCLYLWKRFPHMQKCIPSEKIQESVKAYYFYFTICRNREMDCTMMVLYLTACMSNAVSYIVNNMKG